MKLTNKQKAVLHVAKGKLGLDDATYRDILQAHGGVESSKDLEYEGFLSVMKHFEKCGFTPVETTRKAPDALEEITKIVYGDRRPSGMATEGQLKKIYALWWSLGGAYYRAGSEKKALRGFLRKRFRVDHERFLTFFQAHGAIEAIKRITKGTQK